MDSILIKEVVEPIAIIIIFLLLYFLISTIIKNIAKIKLNIVEDKRKQTLVSLINNIIKYLFIIVSIIMILNVYNVDTSAIVASLFSVSFVAGLALQDTLKDFVSGMSIILENQYKIGDTVKIDDFKGEVISLGLKTTRIKAFTGEVKVISNRNVQTVVNYSINHSSMLIDVNVSYDSNLDKVEKVLNDISKKLSEEIEQIYSINILGIKELSSSSIIYQLIIETDPMKHIEMSKIVLKEIKIEFDKNNITIPYNQLVIHNA